MINMFYQVPCRYNNSQAFFPFGHRWKIDRLQVHSLLLQQLIGQLPATGRISYRDTGDMRIILTEFNLVFLQCFSQ